jgi:D-xylonolactonase
LRRIYAYDLTPDGKLENRRLWRQFAENEGYPDGMTIDSENCLWVAHWGGGRVSRFAPSGALLEAIPVPASQVTSCAFGGPDYRSLFITTASIGLEPKMLERDEPLAGSVFSVQVGVRGMPPATANL